MQTYISDDSLTVLDEEILVAEILFELRILHESLDDLRQGLLRHSFFNQLIYIFLRKQQSCLLGTVGR